MEEKIFETKLGSIHYWINKEAEHDAPQLVFLPGLTADHRVFDKQIEFVVNKLLDRGSLAATTIVTNVQDFITIVANGLGLNFRKYE